jgi:hypothetical protein
MHIWSFTLDPVIDPFPEPTSGTDSPGSRRARRVGRSTFIRTSATRTNYLSAAFMKCCAQFNPQNRRRLPNDTRE